MSGTKKAAQSIKGVTIFTTGFWLEEKWSQEDLEEIATNTNKFQSENELRAPIKLGHGEEQVLAQGDGQPALGRAVNLRVVGDDLIADFVDVPDVIARAIAAGMWDERSVELRHVPHTGWVLTGVALLGAQHPEVKGMPPIPKIEQLSDIEQFLSEDDRNKSITPRVLRAELQTWAFSEPTVQETDMPPITEKQFQDLQEKLDKSLEDNKALQATIKEQGGKLKSFEDDADKRKKDDERRAEEQRVAKFDSEKDRLLKPFREHCEKGRMAPAKLAKLERALDDQRAKFSEDVPLSVPVELMMELGVDKLPGGSAADDTPGDNNDGDSTVRADEKLEREIQRVMSEKDWDYNKARKHVYQANPELLKEYTKMAAEMHGRA